MRNSASERSAGVVSRHASNASAAACIAASTSSGADSGASPYCSPVTGLTTGVVRPSAASTCLPLTKLENAFMERLYHDAGPLSVRRSTYDRAMTAAIRTVGVPKEIKTAEHRVAMTPDGVRELERHGIEVHVETGAGEGASISDADYVAAGADIVPTAADAWAQQMVVKVKEPKEEEFAFLRDDLTLFTYLHLAAYPDVAKALVAARTTAARLRDGAARHRRPAAARPDERGRRAAGAAAGRPLPRAAQGRPGRADGRGARRAPGEGRRARGRQRRLERGVDRRRHGGRGRADRQEPRPPALGRPDPPRPDHDAGVEPGGDRAQRRRRRPRDRRRARRRRAGAGRRQRGDGAGR